jgi:hypothetical protein
LITYRAEQDLKDEEKTTSKKTKKSPDDTVSTHKGWVTIDQLDKSETSPLNMDDDVLSPKTTSRTQRGLLIRVRPVT